MSLLFTENAERGAGPLVAVPASTGVIEDVILEQALVTVDPQSLAVERLSAPDRNGVNHDAEIVHSLSVASMHREFCTALKTSDAIALLHADIPGIELARGNRSREEIAGR